MSVLPHEIALAHSSPVVSVAASSVAILAHGEAATLLPAQTHSQTNTFDDDRPRLCGQPDVVSLATRRQRRGVPYPYLLRMGAPASIALVNALEVQNGLQGGKT